MMGDPTKNAVIYRSRIGANLSKTYPGASERAVDGLSLEDGIWSISHRGEDGTRQVEEAEHVISSAPMREIVALSTNFSIP